MQSIQQEGTTPGLQGWKPRKKFYTKTPTNRRELEECFLTAMRTIYATLHSTNRLNISKITRDSGIKDGRVSAFLQETGLLKCEGSGAGTKWYWIADLKPSPVSAGDLTRKWQKWKLQQGGANIKVGRFVEKKDLNTENLFSSKTQQLLKAKEAKKEARKEEVKPSEKEVNEKILETLTQFVSLIQSTYRARSKQEERWNTMLDKMEAIHSDVVLGNLSDKRTQEFFTKERLTVKIPVFFGLFKIKTTIKLN